MINTDNIASVSFVGIIVYSFDKIIEWFGSTEHCIFLLFLIVLLIQIVNLAVRHKGDLLRYRDKQKDLMFKYNVNTKTELDNILNIEPFHKEAKKYIKGIVKKK